MTAQSTAATRLYVHGGNATLSASGDSPLVDFEIPVTIRDITFNATGTQGVDLNGANSVLERANINGGIRGILSNAAIRLTDVTIDGSSYGLYMTSATLTADRVVVKNVGRGIYVGMPSGTLQVTNLLIYNASVLAVDAYYASGSIASTTIADSGTDTGTGPRAVYGSSNLTLRSTIVWAPGTTARVSVEGCNLVSTIAGPTAVPGAMNTNPQFVDAAAHDYHLAANSPARDAVDSGPMSDFERDPRPQGARFDIGADEGMP